ncbi:hypothetical protein LUZ61_005660 [Rhynchospora tenuis]|uniref:FBD domain-containing protein n=1 Tax=Rhynchospora tenuis TaxID=198213 RepID=A0AAD5ZQ88_9POAL|nr:hypothetical protein LUZ61_005660 [Rhynchospora tenuis]
MASGLATRGLSSPSPAASEVVGPDFISTLPDAVLTSILSLVPVKDASRTSVLSSCWRNLWKEAPLRLDDASIEPDELTLVFNKLEWSRKAVSRIILNSHHGPIESLRLSRFNRPPLHPAMDRIVESAVQRGLRELTLVSEIYPMENRYWLPPPVLWSNSLHYLSLSGCQFPRVMPPSVFPNLKELRLTAVALPNDLLQVLLSSCRSLETLHFINFEALHLFSISSPSLHKLVWNYSKAPELIIKDVPNLESLIFGEYTTSFCPAVKVLDAPKLEQLGFVCTYFEALQLGRTFLDSQMEPSISKIEASPCQMKVLSSVKTLAIKMELDFNETIPDLLRCFPCLETLDILKEESGDIYDSDSDIWDEQDSLSSLDHLKTVTMKGFSGDQSDVELLKYLVVCGQALRRITLLCSESITEKFVEMKRRELCIEKRASSDLELIFLDDTENLGTWDEHGSLSFLDHLKTITVKGFYGDRSDMELIKYLVVHGNKLRKIALLCSKKKLGKKFVKNIRQQIAIEDRASPDLELVFFRETLKIMIIILCGIDL